MPVGPSPGFDEPTCRRDAILSRARQSQLRLRAWSRSYCIVQKYIWLISFVHHVDSVAQWIRRWSTEPEILGSIPSGVVF
jgi:hypothetical protein